MAVPQPPHLMPPDPAPEPDKPEPGTAGTGRQGMHQGLIYMFASVGTVLVIFGCLLSTGIWGHYETNDLFKEGAGFIALAGLTSKVA